MRPTVRIYTLQEADLTRLLFVTDIHGSERCWAKLLNAPPIYQLDVIVLGGDITGKGLQPLVRTAAGAWLSTYSGNSLSLETTSAVKEFEDTVRAVGLYPFRATRDEMHAFETSPAFREAVTRRVISESLQRWIAQAEKKLSGSHVRMYAIPGNDDPPYVDELISGSTVLTWAQRRIVHIDEHHEMASEGYTNTTPWHTYRELPESQLYALLEHLVEQLSHEYDAVFNMHVPPHDSGLDDAPVLGKDLRPARTGPRLAPVGSTAVRRLIETHQPLLSLHGHIHEARGATYIGRTLCLNPGSRYEEGMLAGYLINLDRGEVRSYQPVLG